MKLNFVKEVKDLVKMIKEGGDLSDLNKQANFVLDFIEDKELMNQNAIDYIKDNYDIRYGYCMCENEDRLIARLFGIKLAHEVCITAETNRSEEEIINACVEASETYFDERLGQISYSLKEYALNNESYAKILSEPSKKMKFAVKEINEDDEIEEICDICDTIEEADEFINSILKIKPSSLKRFRITRSAYENDKEVSSETVKEVTI